MNESFEEVDDADQAVLDSVQNVLPESEDRRGTFTFTMGAAAETVEDLLEHDSLDGVHEHTHVAEDTTLAEDVTIARLSRSPVKVGTLQPLEPQRAIEYPELPHSDRVDAAPETVIEPTEFDEPAISIDSMATTLDEEEEADIEGLGKTEEQEIQPEELEVQEMEITRDTRAAEISTPESSHFEGTSMHCAETSSEVVYPVLPADSLHSGPIELRITAQEEDHAKATNGDIEMSETASDVYADRDESEAIEADNDVALHDDEDQTADEEFTEASLQLNILRDYQDTLQGHDMLRADASELGTEESTAAQMDVRQTAHAEVTVVPEHIEKDEQLPQMEDTPLQPSVETHMEDITDGLTLSFTPAKAPSADPTPRKLHSPPPPPTQAGPEDPTMTIALDDDTALLKDFLNRAAASKAEKAAVTTHRRESLQNRRDSDVIRHALASPRKVLEEKDPNSPSKYDNELTLDLSQTLTLNMDSNALVSPTSEQADGDETAEEKSLRGSRRSSRTKKSRLPAPASAPVLAQASKIAIRRADGTEHVVLKKSDAQELATLTRANTRKNKQGAFGVTVRLMKLALDSASLPPLDDSTKELIIGKNIRWDEQLAYYQENPETVAEAESLATPDELGMPDPVSTPSAKPKSKISKSSTPKIRRVRGLGTANGTPGKGLLAPASLLPEEVQEEKEAAQVPPQQLPKPKASKIKKIQIASTTAAAPSPPPSNTKLPSLDIVPVGVEPTKERKSRLAAPKKVVLPQPAASLPAEGKENPQRNGIVGATPKKGIPAPKVIVPPTVGMESGLPRRRGRKI